MKADTNMAKALDIIAAMAAERSYVLEVTDLRRKLQESEAQLLESKRLITAITTQGGRIPTVREVAMQVYGVDAIAGKKTFNQGGE